MKIALDKALCLFALISFCSCNGFMPEAEVYEPEYTPEISVFGLVSNDKQYNFIIVERTLTLEEANRPWYGNDRNQIDVIIKNAIVAITGKQDTVRFSFHKDTTGNDFLYGDYFRQGIYLDSSHKFAARPGETYALRITIPGGETVTGTAKMPAVPVLTEPENNSLIAKKSFQETKFFWQDDPETAAYQVLLLLDRIGEERFNLLYDYMVEHPPTTLHDSYLFHYLNGEYGQFSSTVTVKVMAIDRNYYDYKRSHSGIAEITGSYINTVKGGVGAFGAVAIDSVNVRLY